MYRALTLSVMIGLLYNLYKYPNKHYSTPYVRRPASQIAFTAQNITIGTPTMRETDVETDNSSFLSDSCSQAD